MYGKQFKFCYDGDDEIIAYCFLGLSTLSTMSPINALQSSTTSPSTNNPVCGHSCPLEYRLSPSCHSISLHEFLSSDVQVSPQIQRPPHNQPPQPLDESLLCQIHLTHRDPKLISVFGNIMLFTILVLRQTPCHTDSMSAVFEIPLLAALEPIRILFGRGVTVQTIAATDSVADEIEVGEV